MPPALATATHGTRLIGDKVEFRLWAPAAAGVLLRFEDGRTLPMQRESSGDFSAVVSARAGDRYFYQVDDNRPAPDPVSRLLPQGVHGPTEIVDPGSFHWTDAGWRGVNLRDYVIYELHVGTFTPSGTFDGVIERLDYLKRLGVTVIELMPVAAFPGERNWGYDAVSPYAVQASYGGPDGLKRLVNAAHAAGLGVVLDVVYNHLGNEGNYLRMFGPYFTDRHKTPWGDAINFDGAGSAPVRQYFIENALYWVREYHVDGLRLDAIQTIKDDSPYHIVEEIRDRVQSLAIEWKRRVCVIAETDANDARLVRPKTMGGFGLDAVWSDDFHHAMHAVLTGEREGYYQDFGSKEQIVRALNEGFVFQGELFKFWGAARGTKPQGVPLPAHVVAIQNHDQVGNRAQGERLSHLVPRGAVKLAAALLLLAPETPLLFMGQEYDEPAPFQFFTDYGDPALQKAVSAGRRHEFKSFTWPEVPDPQDPATFERSKLHLPEEENDTLRWYQQLIELRKRWVTANERTCCAELRQGNIILQAPREYPRILVIAEFADRQREAEIPRGWRVALANQEDGYRTRIFERE
jgi:maltooligosyltrehalose trehalohydrolase